MFERLVTLMAYGALVGILIAEIDGVSENTILRSNGLSAECLVDRRMADTTFVSDDLTVSAEMLTVVTPEASLSV